MSARQAFIPRPPSRVPSSELHPLPTDAHAGDGDTDMFVNGNGKARSITAFLGQKRGTGKDATAQGAGPTQGTGLGRRSSSANRRSLEGILRPEMTPMSIIPYPATTQLPAGMKQPGAGQTPRKTGGPGVFDFPGPMTPVSLPRGLKKGFGIFAENGEDEVTLDEQAHGSSIAFMRPEGEADVRIDTGTGTVGYMRMFESSGVGGNAIGPQPSVERNVIAPVPGYARGGLGENPEHGRCEIEGMLARTLRSSGAASEIQASIEENNDPQRSLRVTKRCMRLEDMEEAGRHADGGHTPQGSAKRMKHVQHDSNEYIPISSPHIPPTPRPPTSSVNLLDPSLVVGSLLENMEEFVNLEEVEANWKRWKECTTEEWLKGTEELAKDYADILNMVRDTHPTFVLTVYDVFAGEQVKDHLTEMVLAYANMISSVEVRRSEVNRNIETIHGKGKIVRENISKLGMRK